MREIFLEDAYSGKKIKKNQEENCSKVIRALSKVFECEPTDWDAMINACRFNKIDSVTLANSKSFFESSASLL